MSSVNINRFPTNPIPVFKQMEPRLKFNESKTYDFVSGMKSIQYKSVEATSASSSTLSFSYKPPSNVGISRRMYVRYNLTINFTGTNSLGNNLLNIGRSSALRSFPLTTCSNSITLKLNGESITNNQPDQWHQASQHYQQYGLDQSVELSTVPSMYDGLQQFEDVTSLGFARNPLARQLENAFQLPRGASCFYNVISNTPTSAVVKCEVTEPVFCSPCCWGARDGPAFVSLQDLQLTYNLDLGLQRCWTNSTIDGTTLTNIQVGISTSGIPQADANPFLLFEEMTTGFDNPVVFDKEYIYPYISPNVQVSDTFSNVVAGSTVQNSVNNIQYGVVPKSILICVKEKLSDQLTYPKLWNSTDSFARINSLSVQINGSSSILAEASKFDLYNICRKNGLKDSYCGYNNDVGTVLLLEVGSDIPLLDESLASSTQTNFNFAISNLNITNTSNSTKNYQVIVVAFLEGLCAIKNNTCNLTTGLLTREMVLQAPMTDRVDHMSAYTLSGAGFFDKLTSGFKSAFDVGKKIYDTAKTVSPFVKAVLPQTAPVLGAVGLGITGGRRKMKKMGRGILKGSGVVDNHRSVGYLEREDLESRLAKSDYEDNDDYTDEDE